MSLPDVIETFKNGLMHVCLWVLAALAICTLLLLASKRNQVSHLPANKKMLNYRHRSGREGLSRNGGL